MVGMMMSHVSTGAPSASIVRVIWKTSKPGCSSRSRTSSDVAEAEDLECRWAESRCVHHERRLAGEAVLPGLSVRADALQRWSAPHEEPTP